MIAGPIYFLIGPFKAGLGYWAGASRAKLASPDRAVLRPPDR